MLFFTQHVNACRFNSVSAKCFIIHMMPQVVSSLHFFIDQCWLNHFPLNRHSALYPLWFNLVACNWETPSNSSSNRLSVSFKGSPVVGSLCLPTSHEVTRHPGFHLSITLGVSHLLVAEDGCRNSHNLILHRGEYVAEEKQGAHPNLRFLRSPIQMSAHHLLAGTYTHGHLAARKLGTCILLMGSNIIRFGCFERDGDIWQASRCFCLKIFPICCSDNNASVNIF